MGDKSANTVATILLEEYIPRHSFPRTLLSDNSGEFINNITDCICEELKIYRVKSSVYHPEGNAKGERMHKTLNDMIS